MCPFTSNNGQVHRWHTLLPLGPPTFPMMPQRMKKFPSSIRLLVNWWHASNTDTHFNHRTQILNMQNCTTHVGKKYSDSSDAIATNLIMYLLITFFRGYRKKTACRRDQPALTCDVTLPLKGLGSPLEWQEKISSMKITLNWLDTRDDMTNNVLYFAATAPPGPPESHNEPNILFSSFTKTLKSLLQRARIHTSN